MTSVYAAGPGIGDETGLDVFDLLDRLDDLLAPAVAAAEVRYGAAPGADPYRGLYVGRTQVDALLARPAATPLQTSLESAPDAVDGLTAEETVVVALALAPEIDPKYERIFGYLHDDLSLRRPTVGLALDLLCAGRSERLRLLGLFASGGSLARGGLVEVGGPADAPLPSRVLRLDPQLRHRLLGGAGLDERFAGLATCTDTPVSVDSLPLEDSVRATVLAQAARWRTRPGRLQLTGPDSRLLDILAQALAHHAGRPLLALDVQRLPESGPLGDVVCREAELRTAVVQLRSSEPLPRGWSQLAERLAQVVLCAPRPDDRLLVAGFPAVEVPLPSVALRERCWVEAAGSVGLDLTGDQRRLLAASYRLRACDIADSIRIAAARRCLQDPPVPGYAEVRDAASELAAKGVATVARQVELCHGWDDLVLPDDSRQQLRELCARVRHQRQVLDGWGMRRGATAGSGLHALFSGPSGTGKTVGAQVVAGALGLQLWKVDLSHVVSKYIGETEKNLDAIFTVARDCDVVLLFDEADALFGKRSEVRDAHDRYANIEISYLLQRMEEHDGVTVLATNLRQNLDEAFLRRLAFDVRFPFPDVAHRLAIWHRVFPDSVPRDDTVDLAGLAAAYTFSGGQIRNVALAAAYLAAAEGLPVGGEHVRRAARREFQKLGKDIGGPGTDRDGRR